MTSWSFSITRTIRWEGSMRPQIDGILESSLYVSDVPRSVRFYEETLGSRVISELGERGCAMHAGPRQVLLLFKRELRARSNRRTTVTANCTSRSLSHPPNWPTGSLCSKREGLQWKKNATGKRAAAASTFETLIAI
jgi:Glyoxalase/Bleomycin resistance protein/Dioxygenase superfamily